LYRLKARFKLFWVADSSRALMRSITRNRNPVTGI
jgi:hypothetical protein